MTGQDLKNSILQLAIQGKLVEQRKKEGTARGLIEEIKKEKEKVIKEKKIRRKKSLREISEDEIPFDIPESWEWVKFGNLVSFDIGKTPQRSNDKFWGNDYNWISIADMIPNGYVDETKEKITDLALEDRFKNKLVPKGTLLMSFKLTIGRVSILNIPAVHNEAIISIYPYGDKNNIIRNYYFTILPLISSYGDTKGAIKGKTLNSTSLNNLLIPLPPLEEQKRIVEKIEELMPYVDKYGETHIKLEDLNKNFPTDMQKSILQYAIQGKLVEQREEEGSAEELYKEIQEEKEKLIKEGKIRRTKALAEVSEDEIPFDIPENWKWVRLGNMIHNWGQKKPDKIFDYIDVGSIDNVNGSLNDKKNLINPSEAPSRARKIVKQDTVLYSTVRPYLLNICIVDKEFTYEPIASTAFAVLHPYRGLRSKFLFYILRSPMFISYVSSLMIGVAYPAINDKNLLMAPIPLPPLEEQNRILSMIENLLPLNNLVKEVVDIQ